MIKGLPDRKSTAVVPWGPCKGQKLHTVKDHILRKLIRSCKIPYINNAAFDEYDYRRKLGLLGKA